MYSGLALNFYVSVVRGMPLLSQYLKIRNDSAKENRDHNYFTVFINEQLKMALIFAFQLHITLVHGLDPWL